VDKHVPFQKVIKGSSTVSNVERGLVICFRGVLLSLVVVVA